MDCLRALKPQSPFWSSWSTIARNSLRASVGLSSFFAGEGVSAFLQRVQHWTDAHLAV